MVSSTQFLVNSLCILSELGGKKPNPTLLIKPRWLPFPWKVLLLPHQTPIDLQLHNLCSRRVSPWLLLIFLSYFVSPPTLSAQEAPINCQIEVDEIDPFDSLRTVASASFPVGNFLINQVETIDGPKLAPEAEAMVMFSQKDSLSVIFLHLELPEYHYVRTEKGWNVKFLMQSDSSIVGFYTVPDEGTFSKETNMRHYQHTALIPMDTYYRLANDTVALIRVEYENHRRTIAPTPAQQAMLREAFRCVGERVGFYPRKP